MEDGVITNHCDDKAVKEINSTEKDYTKSVNSQCCHCHAEIGETTRLLSNCCEHSNGQITSVSPTNEPPVKQKITRRQIILLILIVYGNFWIATCYSLLAPFFPAEAEKKGASPTIYGLIFGVFQLVLFVSSPIYGKIIPIATSRFLLVSGLFVSSACSILFGALYYSPPGLPFIISAFAVRIVEALGSSAYYVAALTTASSEFTENRATVVSSLESVTGIGLIVGPTVGGALYQIGGYTLPFFVLGGIIFIGALIAAVIIPHLGQQEEKSGNLMGLMSKSTLYTYWIVFMYCFCIIGYNDATLAYHLKEFKFSPFVLGCIFIIPGGLYALGAPIWGFLCDKLINPEICCFTGSVLVAVGFIFIGPLPFLGLSMKLWLIIVSLVLFGIGLGGMMISSFILAINGAVKQGLPNDVSTYALISGVFSGVGALGGFFGPTAGGFMVDHIGYGYSTVVIFGVSVLLVVIVLFSMICSYSKQRKESENRQTSVEA